MVIKLTKQEIVDRALTGLMNQKAIAKDEGANCFYYEEDTGNRCAIGLCVDVETAKKLQSRYTGIGVRGFDEKDSKGFDVEFAHCIQRQHDLHADFVQAMIGIADVAEINNLTIPKEVEEFLAHAQQG